MRRAVVRSLAKINLDLRVLGKRADGYHELQTVFQTISLADRIEIEFEPSRRTRISLDGNLEIADNLVTRAAGALCDAAKITGAIHFRLTKRIPMGAGLGGGSSNAAAVLLALPALSGSIIDPAQLRSVAAELGSDVPFFLFGGTALGLGRGTELYPLPDVRRRPGLLVVPSIHVSTPEAYRGLNRGLTTPGSEPDTKGFQSLVWDMGEECLPIGWQDRCTNDFETVVFSRHPQLASIRDQLRRSGARPAMMTGSGSALFGLFDSRERTAQAAARMELRAGANEIQLKLISLVNRSRYRKLWLSQLREHVRERIWPPQSRYSKK